jgi:hypothetical protein
MQYCLTLLHDPFGGTNNCATGVEVLFGEKFDGNRIPATT